MASIIDFSQLRPADIGGQFATGYDAQRQRQLSDLLAMRQQQEFDYQQQQRAKAAADAAAQAEFLRTVPERFTRKTITKNASLPTTTFDISAFGREALAVPGLSQVGLAALTKDQEREDKQAELRALAEQKFAESRDAAKEKRDFMAMQNEANRQNALALAGMKTPPMEPKIVADKTSETGWAYEDLRTGRRTMGAPAPAGGGGVGGGKPMPASVAKIVDDDLEAIGTASNIQKDMGRFVNMLTSKQLDLGPVANIEYKARNLAGASTPQSRAYGEFVASLEKLRNDSLRLNKGVQTEGDAVRAWNEIFSNPTDNDYVKSRLQKIQKFNQDAIQFKKSKIDQIRRDYKAESIDYTPFEGAFEPGPNPAPNVTPTASKTGPRVGTVEGGYVFMGGDPAKPSSWKLAK